MSKRFSIPLGWLLIFPFLLQIVGALGLVSYFSYRSGEQTVRKLSDKLLEKVSAQVTKHLEHYLYTPQAEIAANSLAIEQEALDINNRQQLQKYLWRQLVTNPSLESNNFWYAQGTMLGYRRIQSSQLDKQVKIGEIVFQEISSTNPRERHFYRVDSRGNPRKMFHRQPITLEQLPWYASVKNKREQGWSTIVEGVVSGIPRIGAFVPIYTDGDRYQGMFTCFVSLETLSQFLRQIDFAPAGEIFIINR